MQHLLFFNIISQQQFIFKRLFEYAKSREFYSLLQLVEKVIFDKLSDFREMQKMTFSLPRRRTKVLREGKKRSKQCQNRTKFDALYDFLPIHFKLIILRFLYLLKRLLFLSVYRQSERSRSFSIYTYSLFANSALPSGVSL